jgi:hypothetical protein
MRKQYQDILRVAQQSYTGVRPERFAFGWRVRNLSALLWNRRGGGAGSPLAEAHRETVFFVLWEI